MKTSVIYFSPTGTSRKVAEAIASGISDTFKAIDATKFTVNAQFGHDDIVILAAPVYGGHMAPIAVKRMDAIRGNETPAVVVAM